MAEYRKLTRSQVKAKIRKNGKWEGITTGNKVNLNHLEGGYSLGNHVIILSEDDLYKHINSSMYYLPKELGNRISFYEKI